LKGFPVTAQKMMAILFCFWFSDAFIPFIPIPKAQNWFGYSGGLHMNLVRKPGTKCRAKTIKKVADAANRALEILRIV